MSLMPTEALLWKLQGNSHCKDGKFLKAIECYDEALRRITSQSDAILLLLNRCHARLSSQHYDAALEDAKAVLDLDLKNEKGLFRAARALYGLRRFKDCRDYLQNLLAIYPKNQAALTDVARCECRFQEEAGHFDFAAMLDEAVAKSPRPHMDRADWVGPIEIRKCAIESHGRGLFTTKAVKAGDLLLVEKAFSTAFDTGNDEIANTTAPLKDINSEKSVAVLKLRAELATGTFVKLHRNPSVVPRFAALYPGPDAVEDIDEATNLPELDDAFVQYRIIYNAFGFPIFSHDYHWKIGHDPDSLDDDSSGSMGMWIHASYINHSCYPLVRRSFIGDMMIWRASHNLPADTELKFGYISGLESYAKRQEMLQKYGFDCNCQVCLAEKDYSHKKTKRRNGIIEEIIRNFETNSPKDLQMYFELIDKLDATYTNPPTLEPRKALVPPLINLVTACHTDGMPYQVVDLVLRMLQALGFETEITASSFKILQWGFLVDDIVMALADLIDAYAVTNPALVSDVTEIAKTVYEIMCGERVSWDGTYGRGRAGS